jgi:hypothetical protein
VSSYVYAESYPEPNQAWYNCGYSPFDSGFQILSDDNGYTAFTMNVASISGASLLATWNSISESESSSSYPNICTGGGALASTTGLSSISVTNSGTTWAAGATLTVYGLNA